MNATLRNVGLLLLLSVSASGWTSNTALFNADVVNRGNVYLGQVQLTLGPVTPGTTTYYLINSQSDSLISGQRNFTVVSSTVQGFPAVPWMFCVDVFGAALQGQTYTYDVYLAIGVVGRLLQHWNDTPNDFPPAVTNADLRAAGLQVALWEYAYDGVQNNPLNLQSGDFVHLPGSPNYAPGAGNDIDSSAQYLLDKQYAAAPYWYLKARTEGAQDFATVVPEPASLWMLVTVTALVARCARGQRKRA